MKFCRGLVSNWCVAFHVILFCAKIAVKTLNALFANTRAKIQKIQPSFNNLNLWNFLSRFKTHPCINFNNGCNEEIPATLNDLKAHDQCCIYQMVPCLKVDCKRTVKLKNLAFHVKRAHINNILLDRGRYVVSYFFAQINNWNEIGTNFFSKNHVTT